LPSLNLWGTAKKKGDQPPKPRVPGKREGGVQRGQVPVSHRGPGKQEKRG